MNGSIHCAKQGAVPPKPFRPVLGHVVNPKNVSLCFSLHPRCGRYDCSHILRAILVPAAQGAADGVDDDQNDVLPGFFLDLKHHINHGGNRSRVTEIKDTADKGKRNIGDCVALTEGYDAQPVSYVLHKERRPASRIVRAILCPPRREERSPPLELICRNWEHRRLRSHRLRLIGLARAILSTCRLHLTVKQEFGFSIVADRNHVQLVIDDGGTHCRPPKGNTMVRSKSKSSGAPVATPVMERPY